jgi:hypothetical protein
MPEPDQRDFAMRTWVFIGHQERCTPHVLPVPIIKAANAVARTASDMPEAVRVERARLGFDYGKFDFVIHNGVPVLLDTNLTSASPGWNLTSYRRNSESC